MEPSGDYLIVANKNPYSESVKEKYSEFVTLIDSPLVHSPPLSTFHFQLSNRPSGKSFGTGELLGQEAVKKLIAEKEAAVLVFKNTPRIEPIVKSAGWKLLNPSAYLAEQVENKISQIEWLGELGRRYLPPHRIQSCKFIYWNNDPFIIQWAHGHTGGGTILIKSDAELKKLQARFPERAARVTKYIAGPSFTINAISASDKILTGNISYQITGLAPFTDHAFATIGNDWGVVKKMLSRIDIETIETMARNIGKKLNIAGWRGLFGIDVIREERTGRIYLIEINARQPASATFESQLQRMRRGDDDSDIKDSNSVNSKLSAKIQPMRKIKGITVFEAHLRALRGEPIDNEIIPIEDGAQIVQRVTTKTKNVSVAVIENLKAAGYSVISYPNSDENSDLVRIQSESSLTEEHEVLNSNGKRIVDIIGRF